MPGGFRIYGNQTKPLVFFCLQTLEFIHWAASGNLVFSSGRTCSACLTQLMTLLWHTPVTRSIWREAHAIDIEFQAVFGFRRIAALRNVSFEIDDRPTTAQIALCPVASSILDCLIRLTVWILHHPSIVQCLFLSITGLSHRPLPRRLAVLCSLHRLQPRVPQPNMPLTGADIAVMVYPTLRHSPTFTFNGILLIICPQFPHLFWAKKPASILSIHDRTTQALVGKLTAALPKRHQALASLWFHHFWLPNPQLLSFGFHAPVESSAYAKNPSAISYLFPCTRATFCLCFSRLWSLLFYLYQSYLSWV